MNSLRTPTQTRVPRIRVPLAGGILALLLLAMGIHPPAAGDTVVLKNGNRIQGEIIDESSQGITVRFPGGTLFVKARDVGSVERESRLQLFLEQGEAYLRRKDTENAIQVFRKAKEENPESEAARKGLIAAEEKHAEELATQGLYQASLEAYRALLSHESDHPHAREAMGKIEATLREETAEEASLAKEIETGPSEAIIARLRALHERFPERREALAPQMARALFRSGVDLLTQNRLEEAEARCLEAASFDPDLAPSVIPRFVFARVRRISSLAEQGEFKKVIEGAEEGLRIAPGDNLLTYLAATGYQGIGKKREAAEGYLKVAGLSRSQASSRALEDLQSAALEKIAQATGAGAESIQARKSELLPGGFREIETEHFIVHHRNGQVGSEVAEAAEAAYGRILQELSLKEGWQMRCTVTIFPSKREFLEATGQSRWAGGSHQIRRKMGSLTDHRIYSFQDQPRLSSSVIPHEVAHAMLDFATGYQGELPLWFQEGFAIQWEPDFVHRYYRRVAAYGAQTHSLIPLQTLTGMTGYPEGDGESKIFYSQGYTIVSLLLEEKGLADLIRFASELARDPRALDSLLERFYRIRGIKALENRCLGRIST